jgi:hypothetical protein
MRLLLLPLWILLTTGLGLPRTASAQYVADIAADLPDTHVGNGVCDVAGFPNGSCSIRAAVQEITWSGSGSIALLEGFTYTIGETPIGVGGETVIRSPVPVDSPLQVSIVGSGSSRLFDVYSYATLSLHDVVLRDGWAPAAFGGALFVDRGHAELFDCWVESNRAQSGGAVAVRSGSLRIERTTIASNEARAVTNDGSTTGGVGGGIYASRSAVLVKDSTISFNEADMRGGGMYLASTSRLQLVNSTMSGNRVMGVGSAGGLGGAIWNGSGLDTEVRSSTITRNFARAKGGGIVLGQRRPRFEIQNSVLAENQSLVTGAADCAAQSSLRVPPLTSLGYNALGDVAECEVNLAPGDLRGVPLRLGALAHNGGPTATHAPRRGSPLIDAADPSGCRWNHDDAPATPEEPLPEDQRGSVRVADGLGDMVPRCDIGAVELVPEPAGRAMGAAIALCLAWLARRKAAAGADHQSRREQSSRS